MTLRTVIRVSPSFVTWVVFLLTFLALALAPRPVIAQDGAATTTLENPSAPSEEPHPLDPALIAARHSLQHIQTNVRDYTAVMSKRVRVDGQLNDYQHTFVKIRNRRLEDDRLTVPMSVYLYFLNPAAIKGREVIWVENRNNGKMAAHEPGLKGLIKVDLDPNGSMAMRGQRYPITEIGLEKLVQKVIETGNRDRKRDECQVKSYDGAKINQRVCRVFEIIHPVERPYFDFHRAQVFFDNDLNMLIRYASWSWPKEQGGKPVLEEEYTYTDIKINVGLTDLDFDPDNPAYGFW
jgi:hypothetical protein